jgi:hypothetical protein
MGMYIVGDFMAYPPSLPQNMPDAFDRCRLDFFRGFGIIEDKR